MRNIEFLRNQRSVLRASWRAVLCCLLCALGLNATGQPELDVNFVCAQGQPGDMVCVDVVVDDFTDVEAVQIILTFDPTVLDFTGIQNDALGSALWSQPGPDDVRYIWVTPNGQPVSLTNGTVLFQACFTIIGLPGSSSMIGLNFDHPGVDIVIGTALEEFIINSQSCQIDVMPATSLGAFISSCGADMGIGNGNFTITIFGGTPPYSYSWTGASTGNGLIGMENDSDTHSVPPGSYTLTITDAAGAMSVHNFDVDAVGFFPVVSSFDPTCFDFTNGRITAEAANGTPPYSVLWDNVDNVQYAGSGFISGSGGSLNINSLPVGSYHVTITDDRGCQVIDTVDLISPPITFTVNTANASCNGSGDGVFSINFGPSNSHNISPSWVAGTFNVTLLSTNLLNPGDYSVLIEKPGVAMCDSVFSFTIGSNTVIDAEGPAGGPIEVIAPSCLGAMDGEVSIVGTTNGIPGGIYTFQLFDSTGTQIVQDVTSVGVNYTLLAAGNYSVVLFDANVVAGSSCISDTIAFTITAPPLLTITLDTTIPNGCLAGSATGAATVSASGGTLNGGSDYVYSWDGGAFTGNSITGLTSGMHNVIVTDDAGCTADLDVDIPQSTPPRIDTIIASNLSCTGQATTTLEVVFTEGTSPVTSIQWSSGALGAIVTNQSPGLISVTIRDDFFCFDIETDSIPGEPIIVIDSIVAEDPTCPGDADGRIAVHASLGIEPYIYIWSTGDTTSFNLLAGLAAGTYGVTIFDADTCGTIDTVVTLNDVAPISFAFNNVLTTSCSNTCDGQATIVPGGGVAGLPFDFFWESGFTEQGLQSTATDLCPGMNSVIVTQDNVCFFEDSVFVPAADAVAFNLVAISNVTCFGADDGFIALLGTGGAGGYTYQWNALPDGPGQNNLGPGNYVFTITDANACTATDSVMITQPDTLIAAIDSAGLVGISCNFTSSGVITVTQSGGQGSYSYNWDPLVSTGNAAGQLTAGLYRITVTDGVGCTDSISILLEMPDTVAAILPPISAPTCTGELTNIEIGSVTGGVGGYFFTINNGQRFDIDSAVAVTAGKYVVTVFDSTGCGDRHCILVNDPLPIELSIFPEDPVIDLGSTLELMVIADNTQGPIDSIIWISNGPLTCFDCADPVVANVQPTHYSVTVWDSAGCSASLTVLVDVNAQRQVYIPNIFTPNFDGRNDDLVISTGLGIRAIPSVRIFDRWGELMVEHLNVTPTLSIPIWDGSFRNNAMQPGVYVYVIEVEFEDDETLVFRGDVTLLR